MTYLEKAQQFQEVLKDKGSFEAFERFYHDDCIVEELPTSEVRRGKNEQREAIQAFFGSVSEFHGSGVKSIMSNEEEGMTMIESWFDITFKDGQRRKMEEIGIQQWSNDQIISEKFYYNAPTTN